MQDRREYFILKNEIIYLGDEIKVGDDFFESQSKTISGRYKLEKINLNDIDVVKKGIADRSYFYWEDGKNLDIIKENFYKTPPVILEYLNGSYYSVDGHHRITVAKELGLTNILAFVIKVDKLTHNRDGFRF